ncbi:hypothetical protein NLG97_g5549 [Lecanicillium saksenae]|uniref:Uncharacterized protein n=1 Tax=Lecanicillium saksenae TaxID=468837 RepID=A0ACC1QVB4_9HYPO|nr:hypothetical protein NLG97_g5549 [Lecanicillium saksenae]
MYRETTPEKKSHQPAALSCLQPEKSGAGNDNGQNAGLRLRTRALATLCLGVRIVVAILVEDIGVAGLGVQAVGGTGFGAAAAGGIARAAEPTKGQAWAFPEEEIKRVGNYDESRRSSVTDSIASSQFTTESRLPPGQRRLEDSSEFARLSGPSSEFPSVHHHTMQHKQLSDLQAEEGAGGPGAQPYSRTPELRVSHKLAERKRRTEMKELFDQLRDLMPQERGSKASKWEILTKGESATMLELRLSVNTNALTAIAEHQRQSDHIRILQSHYNTAVSDNEILRRELQNVKMELAQARGESHPPPQSSQSQSHPPPAQQYPPEHYQQSPNGTELPPLRSISNGMSSNPDSMTGVQYDAPRANGYRDERY